MRHQNIKVEGIVACSPSAFDEMVENLSHEDFRGGDAALGHWGKKMRGVKLQGAGCVRLEVVQVLGSWHLGIDRRKASPGAEPSVMRGSCPHKK